MAEQVHFWDAVREIRRVDGRFAPEAYGLIMDSLELAIHNIGFRRHVSGTELLESLCEHAKSRYGLLAYTLLEKWGIKTTDDVGEAVFQLVEAHVLARQEKDTREDFHDIFDLRDRLEEAYFDKD
jgi:uncharacterized repeat protein (TIGR04138 family)